MEAFDKMQDFKKYETLTLVMFLTSVFEFKCSESLPMSIHFLALFIKRLRSRVVYLIVFLIVRILAHG